MRSTTKVVHKMRFFFFSILLSGTLLLGDDQPTVFKSDVAMTRIDAQVLDRDGRAVSGLQINDFKLTLDGKILPIRNLASEKMPIDVLLLLDVSRSMEPHVQRIASAAQQALNVLADRDRVAIMVFDTRTRVRLSFQSDHAEVTKELNHLLHAETFAGGTLITHALVDAASYVQRQARPDARRAIVILTDDQTQDEEDVPRVDAALARANAVLSFLQAPYEEPTMSRGGRRRGPWGGGGGSWPGGGGIGFPGGGGWPGGGGVGLPGGHGGGMGGGDRSHSAGTADIARDSGGDTMNVDDASALEDTLARLRQRYALYFYYPEGKNATGTENVKVDLSNEAKLRYSDAEIHYRHVYMASASGEQTGTAQVTRTHAPSASETDSSSPTTQPTPTGRRRAVSDDSSSPVNTVEQDPGTPDKSDNAKPSQDSNKAPTPTTDEPRGGWPAADPASTPPQ
jgi:VWFA-related protein